MDSTGDSHGSECTTGSGAMMLLDPCLLLAPATWSVSWDVMEVNEGLSPWSLQLCPFPPPAPPQLLESQKGFGLPPAGQHCCRTLCPHSPLPLPHNPSLCAGGCLRRAGGKALPYGARGPGDCRSLGLGPVAMGAAPRILHSRHSLGSGVESHWPGLCSLHVTVRVTVSWPVPPAWHHVLSHPAPSGP